MLAVLVLGPFWWLYINNTPGNQPAKPVHIAQLRQLAASLPGPRPAAVQYTILATRTAFGDLFAAGIGLKRRPLAMISWYLPVPGGDPILIDSNASPEEARARGFRNFDIVAQQGIATAATHAGLILATYQPLATSAFQASGRSTGKAGIGAAIPTPTPAANNLVPWAAAPGVVIIPASDYAPGAQLIYVQLANGREFLFTGEIATFYENWTQLRARSQLAAHWLAPQNRARTYPWLRTIRQLHFEAPKLTVVPFSDYTWLDKQRGVGNLREMPRTVSTAPVPSP